MQARGLRRTARIDAILDTVVVEKLRLLSEGRDITKLGFDERKRLLRDIYVDLSQNPCMRAFTSTTSRTLCTSTLLYSLGQDRVILPIELLYIQGHSRGLKVPIEVRSSALKELAGEGMSLPCLSTALWALYLTKGFP